MQQSKLWALAWHSHFFRPWQFITAGICSCVLLAFASRVMLAELWFLVRLAAIPKPPKGMPHISEEIDALLGSELIAQVETERARRLARSHWLHALGALIRIGLQAIILVAANAFLFLLVSIFSTAPTIWLWVKRLAGPAFLPYVVVVTTVGIGLLMFSFKRTHRFWYGIAEVLVALASSWTATSKLVSSDSGVAGWLGLLTAIYFLVRGLDNTEQGFPSSRIVRYFGKFYSQKH